MVSMFKDYLPLFKEFLLQIVNQCLQRRRLQALEVHYVKQLAFQPLLVLVLVLNQATIELLLDVGEDVQQFVEVLLRHHAYR